MSETYVHGHHPREGERLRDQADALSELLHADTTFPAGSTVLDAGCAVGATTLTVARRNPGVRFHAVDKSPASIAEAGSRAAAAGITNVEFQQADLMCLPYGAGGFDHVLVCFVLEHLADPVAALATLRALLRPGGTITVIEGDHGSACFHPESSAAHAAIQCQITLQRAAGGNALIGRQLVPLIAQAGFEPLLVSPRTVYAAAHRPDLVDGFTRRTFTAMINGIREQALAAGLISPETFDTGIRDLRRTAEPGGAFSYTFFKCVARA